MCLVLKCILHTLLHILFPILHLSKSTVVVKKWEAGCCLLLSEMTKPIVPDINQSSSGNYACVVCTILFVHVQTLCELCSGGNERIWANLTTVLDEREEKGFMQICTLLNMNRTAAAFLTARSLGHHLFEFFSQSDGNCMSRVPTPTLKVAK